MAGCLLCNTPIEPFLSFGKMPIANGFLTPEQFDDEYFFELKVSFCPSCAMVQLGEIVDREKMFHENYAFYSSTSNYMQHHFKQFAEMVQSQYLSADPFVVEMGSNDGILLQNFAKAGQRHLGIEPSANVAEVAREKGITTICEFFDEALAERIVEQHGHADAFLAANVMCHIPTLHTVAKGIRRLLKPEGVLIFEDPYLGDIIEKTSYDQIYDEHAFYFSVTSVERLFGQHDLQIFDVEPQTVHGGSMRYFLAPKGSRPVSSRAAAQREKEDRMGLHERSTYDRFRENVERSREKLMAQLDQLRDEGKRVVGYGATSKSTTVTNYCGITPEHVEFICDTTPIKQGRFSPGAHIPVRRYEDFQQAPPEYSLLFAWNHAAEILNKEEDYRKANGKFIVYVPEVGVLS